MSQGKVKNSAS